jgi:tetratricopeptide (TPR) repeat protein
VKTVRSNGEMRMGGGVRAFATAGLVLGLLLLAGCPGKKEAPQSEATPTVNQVFQDGVDALRRNEIDKAVTAFGLIAEKAQPGAPEIPQAHFYLGLIAYRAGKMDLAVENFTAALKVKPDMAQARLSLGNAQFAAGQTDAAIASWEQLATDRPNLASVHNNLGVAYLDRDNLDKAVEHLEQTVALSPDNYRAHANLADAYRRKGMTAEAEAAERKAKAIRSRMLAGRQDGEERTAIAPPATPEFAPEGTAPEGTASEGAAPEAPAPTATP